MSDRDALLAAIIAHPDEDTPRLAFADYLDEPEPDTGRGAKKAKDASPSAWAGLIRAECALARLADDGTPAAALFRFFTEKDAQSLPGVRWDRVGPGMARLVELWTRANQWRRAAAKSLGPAPGGGSGVTVASGATHRGFRDELRIVDEERAAAHLPGLLDRHPRLAVALHLALSAPDVLVGAGLPRLCRGLRLGTDLPGHAELLNAMGRAPETAGVRTLELTEYTEDDAVTARALDAVVSGPHWSGLRHLALSVVLGPRAAPEVNEAFERLLRAPHLRGLRRLDLTGCGDPTEFLTLVLALPELRELNLTDSSVGDTGAELLAGAPAPPGLRYLDLESNGVTGRGASALLASPHLAGLAVLHLNHNPVRNLDRAALAAAPAGGLRLAGFHGARLTVRDVGALASSPRLSELVYFDADDNGLPASAFVRLVRGFGERAPAILYLTGNDIGAAGVDALTTWPAAANVDLLHLAGNRLPTAAARALAACPHLRQLTHLCASCAHPEGVKALKARFGKRAVV